MTSAQITQDFLRKSYSQLFGVHYPDIRYIQQDRPHLYNLFLKIIALVILLIALPLLTALPVYPILYILTMYDFNGAEAFSSGVGSMNIWWIVILYVYYIYGAFYFGMGFYGFVALFMGLTPLFVILSWYYASPVSIHDILAGTYNSIMKTQPFSTNGIGFTVMRCAADTNIRLVEAGSTDAVAEGITSLFGIGISGVAILLLVCLILISAFFVYWSSLTIQSHQLKQDANVRVRIQSNNAT